MVKTVLQILFIIVLACLVFAYYALVLPQGVAGLVAILIAVVLCLSLLMGKVEPKVVMMGSAALAAWPAGALISEALISALGLRFPPAVYQSLAPLAAMGAGHISYTWAEKRDRARDIALSSVSVITLYTLVAAVYSGQRLAVAFACACVAVACVMAKTQMIVPPEHERVLFFTAGVSAGAAMFHLVITLLF